MTNYALISGICGSILQILFCVGVISGCVSLCCWCHKKCRKRQRVPTVVYIPSAMPPAGYPQPNPNYQPVPVQPPNMGVPTATAPPSYQEATDPRLYLPGVGPMYPIPLQPDQNPQQPFYPEHCPPKYDHN